jgi:nucleotide-binding universal stress UspA family protein
MFARRVIVGASGSPGSIPALRYAGNLAVRDDAPLIAVHAWLPPGGDLADRRTSSPDLRRIWAEAAAGRLRDALDAAWGCLPDGLDLRLRVVRGQPGQVLVDTASSADDLLVVGAGRRGWPGRLWRGSVSRHCLSRASCPVLAVPPASRPRRTGTGPGYWWFRPGPLTVEQALRAWERQDIDRL